MPHHTMLRVATLLVCVHMVHNTMYHMRTGKAKITYNSVYLVAYHLHALGTFPSISLRNCIYQCQNNDYCRTANYFQSNIGTLCSLFEEHSFVGRIVNMPSPMSVVISFNLCPPGYTEPTYICFGVPANIQPPVLVQQALSSLHFIQQFPILTYHPTVLSSAQSLYLPVHTQRIIQQFEWPSLKFITNVIPALPIYSFDTDIWGNLLLSSSNASKIILVTGPAGNWSYSSVNYYAVFLSDVYVVAIPTSGSSISILNATNGQLLFSYTMPTASNLWGRIINHQLYITSSTGLRRVDLTQGTSATAITIVPSLSCKEIFLDASGRLYLEKVDATVNNSIVFDLNGTQLANYSSGSKMIVKTSKYTYFVFNNQINPLQLYAYP